MDYSIIFKKLSEIGITKTKLREAVGFSTVTLAKISAGESINLDVLAKICDYLKIDINLIINNGKDEVGKKWDFINSDELYTTILWYRIVGDNKLVYLFGYAIKSIEKVDDRNNWEVGLIKSDNVLQFKQTTKGKSLLSLIKYITLNESLINYFNENGFDVNKKMISKKLDLRLLDNKIMTYDYKMLSKRMLYPKNIDIDVKENRQMQHSFSEEVCICYGMETKNKIEYLTGENDIEFYKNFFMNIVNLYDSDTDVLKIGNFEIYEFISKNFYEIKPNIKIKKFNITFKSKEIKFMNIGNSFKLLFRGIYNDAEVINKLYDIYVSSNDYKIEIELPEEIDGYEIRIYKNDNDDLMLIGYEKESILKRININLNFGYENININIPKKNNKEYKFVNYSTEHINVGDDNSYGKMKDQIQLNNINNNYEMNDNYYERNDSESKDNYYNWFKNNIIRFNPSEIWIFDRYLNVKFMNALLGILDKNNIPICLVTAINENKIQDYTKRVETLKGLLKECNDKSSFDFKLYKADEKKFHDRFIFLKRSNEILCFNMSNSFDDESENYGTYICKTSKKMGEKIWGKYCELINDKKLLYSNVKRNLKNDLKATTNINELKNKYKFESYKEIKEFIVDGNVVENEELKAILDYKEKLKAKTKGGYILRYNYRTDDANSIYDYFTYLYNNLYSYEYSTETTIFEKLLYSNIDTYIKLFDELNKEDSKAFDKLLLLTARVVKFPKVESSKFYINKLLNLNKYELDILCYTFVVYNINNDFTYDINQSANIDIVMDCLPKCKFDEVIFETFKNASLAYIFKININMSQELGKKDGKKDIDTYINNIVSLVNLLVSIIQKNNLQLNLDICKSMISKLFEINSEVTTNIVLLMLYKQNVISDDLLYEICFFMIFKRTEITEYKFNNYFFTERSNRELFNVMMLILNSESDICNNIFKDCVNYQNKIATLLNDYFLRERNPELWRANVNSLFYLEFCKCFVKKYMSDVYTNYEDVNKLAKANRAVEDIANHYNKYLKNYCEIYNSLIDNFENRFDEMDK